MSDFIGECRREWKRLGVADRVADEMAAELDADLQAAEADGATVEDVLGARASSPREFAAEWAAERGVTKRRTPIARGRRRSAIPSAIAAFAAVAISGAVLAIVASPAPSKRLSLFPAPLGLPSLAVVREARRIYVGPPLRIVERPMRVHVQEVTPGAIWVGPLPPNAAATPQLGAVEIRIGAHDDARTVAWVLLIVGLAGAILLTLIWLATSGRVARHLDRAESAP